jgi:hypothetical protein
MPFYDSCIKSTAIATSPSDPKITARFENRMLFRIRNLDDELMALSEVDAAANMVAEIGDPFCANFKNIG